MLNDETITFLLSYLFKGLVYPQKILTLHILQLNLNVQGPQR